MNVRLDVTDANERTNVSTLKARTSVCVAKDFLKWVTSVWVRTYDNA